MDHSYLPNKMGKHRKQGLTTAIDACRAGDAGMHLPADLQPDLINLDMALTRDIDSDASRRAIVSGIVGNARQLGGSVIAKGIETRDDLTGSQALGVGPCRAFRVAPPETETFLTIPDY